MGPEAEIIFLKRFSFFVFFSSQERHGSICFRRGKLQCALILLYLAEWVTSLPFYRDVVLTENLRNQTNLLTEVGRNRWKQTKLTEIGRNWPKLGETDRNRRNWPKLDKTIRKQTEAFVIRRVHWLVSFMNIGSCKMHSSKENDMSCFFDRILLHIPSLIGNYNEKNDKTMINLCFSDISDEPDQLLQPLTLVFLPSLIKCSFINWFQLWLTGERWYRRGRRSSSSWWPDPLGQRWGS